MRIVRLLAAASAASVLAVLTGTVLTGSPALAHNSLTDASPAKNATLKEAPAEVKLSFLQKLDPEFMTIAVTDSQKQPMTTEKVEADGKVATLALPDELPNGEYTVAYRVVSQDGHPVQGSYKFTVDNPAAVASPTPGPSTPVASPSNAAPPPSPVDSGAATDTLPASGESSGPGWGLIIGIVAVVVLLGAGGLVLARRRKTS